MPTATLIEYDPSDGVGASVGDVKILNALVLLSDDGTTGSLLVTFVNSGSSSAPLNLQYVDGGLKTTTRQILSEGSTSFGYSGEEQIRIDSIDAEAGSLFPVYFQYGDFDGSEVLVPVFPADAPHYEGLAPTSAEG